MTTREFLWAVAITAAFIFGAVFIHYDRAAIEAQLPDCPFLVLDETIGKEICVSPEDYEAYWRGECPDARAENGVFECQP